MSQWKFLSLICLQVVLGMATATLPEPPSYIFAKDSEVCVYAGLGANSTDSDCFLYTGSYNIISLEIDYQDAQIFVAVSGQISVADYADKSSMKPLAYSVGVIRDLSYDWIAENLYYTDVEMETISVVNRHADHGVTLMKGMDSVYWVAVAPIQRYLFWSVKENGTIGRSSLDGSNRNDLFFTEAASPSGLTVDHTEERLYWVDSYRGSIESTDLNGQEHRVRFEDFNTYPLHLTLDKDYVVWVDYHYYFPTIIWTNKTTGVHEKSDYHFTLSGLHDVIAYSDYNQPAGDTNICGENRGGCSQLCFALTETSRRCTCSVGYELHDDTKCVPADRGNLEDNVLIADTGRGQIFFYNTKTENVSALDIPTQSYISDVACDPVMGKVFWVNTEDETINSANMDGSGITVVKSFPQGHSIVGLAVDHLKKLLFYCDIESAGVVMSMSYDGADENLIWSENHTAAIVPDYHRQHLYLAIIGIDARIIRVDYDGSNQEVIISDMLAPLAITIDFTEEKLYWFDYGGDDNFLEWSNLDGSERDRWKAINRYPSVAVLADFIYLAGWDNSENQLLRVKKGDVETFTRVGTDQFFHISRLEVIPPVTKGSTMPGTTKRTTPGSTPATTRSTTPGKATSTVPAVTSTSEPGLSSTASAPDSVPSQTPPTTSTTTTDDVRAPDSQQVTQGKSTSDKQTVAIAGGVAGAIALVVIVAVIITACVVIKRRRAPMDPPIVENAFENPGYDNTPANPAVHPDFEAFSQNEAHIYERLGGIPKKQ